MHMGHGSSPTACCKYRPKASMAALPTATKPRNWRGKRSKIDGVTVGMVGIKSVSLQEYAGRARRDGKCLTIFETQIFMHCCSAHRLSNGKPARAIDRAQAQEFQTRPAGVCGTVEHGKTQWSRTAGIYSSPRIASGEPPPASGQQKIDKVSACAQRSSWDTQRTHHRNLRAT